MPVSMSRDATVDGFISKKEFDFQNWHRRVQKTLLILKNRTDTLGEIETRLAVTLDSKKLAQILWSLPVCENMNLNKSSGLVSNLTKRTFSQVFFVCFMFRGTGYF